MELATTNQTNETLVEQAFAVESIESTIVKAIALSLVTFVAVVGNCLVMAAVYQTLRLRTVTNYLIVNMAVADLLYIVIAVPPIYIHIFNWYEWAFSSHSKIVYFCKVIHFGQYLFVIISVLTLAAIAIDRFFAICLPFKRVFTKQAFKVIVSAIWFVAATVAAPEIYSKRVKQDVDGYFYCNEDWSPVFDDKKTASRVYTSLLFSVAYCVPFLAMTIMYTIICRKLWQRKIPGELSTNNYKALTESRKKVVKMLIVVVIVFILCWLPVQIESFLWEYQPSILIPPYVSFVCAFMMRAHASLSPCIYAVFSENYRQGFKKALCYCCDWKKDYNRAELCSQRPTSSQIEGRRTGTMVILKSREKALEKYD